MNPVLSAVYPFLRLVVLAVFRLVFRLRVSGLENIPKEGPLLLYANHLHNLDPPLLGAVIPRPLNYMAKEELFRVRLLGPLIRAFGAFPVKRGAQDARAVKTGLRVLEKSGALLIFPEGRRSPTQELGKAHPGVALFALRTHAQVVPVAIVGRYRLGGPLRVIIGSQVNLDAERKQPSTSEGLRKTTEKLMQELKKIIAEVRDEV